MRMDGIGVFLFRGCIDMMSVLQKLKKDAGSTKKV